MKTNHTIILTVRVDYTTDGRNEQHELTAAGLTITPNIGTIESGVQLTNVECYLDGQQITID